MSDPFNPGEFLCCLKRVPSPYACVILRLDRFFRSNYEQALDDFLRAVRSPVITYSMPGWMAS